jgi:hypothetical protein
MIFRVSPADRLGAERFKHQIQSPLLPCQDCDTCLSCCTDTRQARAPLAWAELKNDITRCIHRPRSTLRGYPVIFLPLEDPTQPLRICCPSSGSICWTAKPRSQGRLGTVLGRPTLCRGWLVIRTSRLGNVPFVRSSDGRGRVLYSN